MKRRRRRRWWVYVVIAAVVAAAGVTAGWKVLGGSSTPSVRYLTATAGKGTISRTVQADFTLQSAVTAASLSTSQAASTSSTTSSSSSTTSTSAATTSGSATVSASETGVVTRLWVKAGGTPRTLKRLVSVSGSPMYAFVSSQPLYENLSVDLASGEQSGNVKVLQRALKAAGDYTGAVDGEFDTGTQSALEAWQADEGQSQTGSLDIAEFVWVPKGAVLSAWEVGLGSQLSGQTALATVDFPRRLEAQALVDQADVAALKVGQKARLTIDGYATKSFTGKITYVASQPSSSGSSSTSSSASGGAQYAVVVSSKKLPSFARSGMSGTLEVTIASRKNVLLVPTSAVSGTSGTPYVQVMIDGQLVYRQVSTGMTTASVTQITTGLTVGEVVVTGRFSTSASSSSGQSGGFGIPGLGGGFRRASGSSSGTRSGSFTPAGGGQ